jgi:hypothetical protein
MTATARARILSALPILIGLVVLLAAFRFIGSVLNTTSPAAVIDRLRAADIGVILQSCAFTAASFLLLCGYDVLATGSILAEASLLRKLQLPVGWPCRALFSTWFC